MSLNIYASPEQWDGYLRILRERGSLRDREQPLRTKSGAICTILLAGELIELVLGDFEPMVCADE